MGAAAASNKGSAAMTSPVNWALLGLVIERPSYGYELVQRFERMYGDVLRLSSTSHIYTALTALQDRNMIEVMPRATADDRGGERQPKPHYRATAIGARGYREWLVLQGREEHQRSQLFVRQLAIFAHDPNAALDLIASYRQACLDAAGGMSIVSADATPGVGSELMARLAAEQERLAIGATLAWTNYARREFEQLAEAARHRT